MDCLFCKIIAGEIPSNKIYEDEKILCFKDIAPQAEVHALLFRKSIFAVPMQLHRKIRLLLPIFLRKFPKLQKN